MAQSHLELGVFAPTIGRMPPVGSSSYQLVSDCEQRSEVSWSYNRDLAVTLEQAGLEIFFMAQRHGTGFGAKRFWSHSLDSFSIAAAIAQITKRVWIISTVHTAFYHPGVIARTATTMMQITGGRWLLNLVSGWAKNDFEMLGIPFAEHDRRYQQTEEFVEVLKRFWSEDGFSFSGEHFQISQGMMEPKPVPLPQLANAGSSPAAKAFVARHCDWYFTGSWDLDEAKTEITAVRALAASEGRSMKFITYVFVLCRETEEACNAEVAEILAARDDEAAQGVLEGLTGATIGTAASIFGEGVTVQDLLDNTVIGVGSAKLIGTPQSVAEQLAALQATGFDAVVMAFRHCNEEVADFGHKVVPLLEQMGVREKRT